VSGNTKGGLKAAATNKKRHGKGFYAKIGSLGGKVKNPDKGFGGNRERARLAGAIGGRISKRPPVTRRTHDLEVLDASTGDEVIGFYTMDGKPSPVYRLKKYFKGIKI